MFASYTSRKAYFNYRFSHICRHGRGFAGRLNRKSAENVRFPYLSVFLFCVLEDLGMLVRCHRASLQHLNKMLENHTYPWRRLLHIVFRIRCGATLSLNRNLRSFRLEQTFFTAAAEE